MGTTDSSAALCSQEVGICRRDRDSRPGAPVVASTGLPFAPIDDSPINISLVSRPTRKPPRVWRLRFVGSARFSRFHPLEEPGRFVAAPTGPRFRADQSQRTAITYLGSIALRWTLTSNVTRPAEFQNCWFEDVFLRPECQ